MEMKSTLTAFVVSLAWSMQSDARQTKTAHASGINLSDEIKIEGNFRNLFDSIMENNKKKSRAHLNFLEEETVREQQAFKTLKEELLRARWSRHNNVIGEKSGAPFKRDILDEINRPAKPLAQDINVEGKKGRKAAFKAAGEMRRSECYKMLTFTKEGVVLNNVIGLEDRDKLVAGGVENEAESIFTNAQKVLDRNGSSLDSVYYVEISLVDMNDTQIVDQVFKKHFHQPYPKKLYKQAKDALPLNAHVEAEISATMTIEQLFKKE